jgi:uncharacterized protein
VDIGHAVLICVAGILAGGANAVAGGGTLVSFPALLAIGIPPVTANITSHVGLLSGYLGGVVGYRAELRGQRSRVYALIVVAIAGGVVGALVLLMSPAKSFRVVVPYLVLISCLLLAVQPSLSRWLNKRRATAASQRTGEVTPLVRMGVFVAAVYGSYFGAGLGVLLLATLGIFLEDELQRLNGLKSLLSFVINTVGIVIFIVAGGVHWVAAALLLPSAYVGGLLGARVARRLNPTMLRYSVVVLGVGVAGALVATA